VKRGSKLYPRLGFLLLVLAIGAALAASSSATFSGANGRITFARFVDATKSIEIFSAKPNGTDLRKLTSNPKHVSQFSDWSPDGQKIAFDSDRVDIDGNKHAVQIYVMNSDGTGQAQLTRGPGFHGSPAWFPNGNSLVIDADWAQPRQLQGLWVISASDSDGVTQVEARRLTTGPKPPGYDGEPQVSPDGSAVAFVRFKDIRHSAIFTVPAAGGPPKRLTPFSLNSSDPDWSPNGQKIAFDSGDSGLPGAKGDIYVMGANGGGRIRLTDQPRFHKDSPFNLANNPVWSPSGTKILYTHFLDERTELIVMNANGSGKHPAVKISGFPNRADWGTHP
jgi:Tol biopolymer transport system component